ATFITYVSGTGDVFSQRSRQHDYSHAAFFSGRSRGQQYHAAPVREIFISPLKCSFEADFVSFVRVDSRVALRDFNVLRQAFRELTANLLGALLENFRIRFISALARVPVERNSLLEIIT